MIKYRDYLLEEKVQLEAELDCLLKMLGDKCISDDGDMLGPDNPIAQELDVIAVKLKVLRKELKELEDT